MPAKDLKWSDARRILAVELYEDGMEVRDIMPVVKAAESTIYQWIQRAEIEGKDSLVRTYKPREPKLGHAQRDQLATMLDQGAQAHGGERPVLRGRLAHPEQEPRPPDLRRRHPRARRHPGPRPLRLVPGRGDHLERPRPHRRQLQAQPRHRAVGPRRHDATALVALPRVVREVRRRRLGQRERRERHRVGDADLRLLRADPVEVFTRWWRSLSWLALTPLRPK